MVESYFPLFWGMVLKYMLINLEQRKIHFKQWTKLNHNLYDKRITIIVSQMCFNDDFTVTDRKTEPNVKTRRATKI